MNKFGFRYVPTAGQFQAEYRLGHWSGYRTVRFENGRPKVFSHPLDAAICAANELVTALNGRCEYWTGKTGNEARAAAEALFSRDTGTAHESSNQGTASRSTA